jgi:hypothetical protein
MVDENSHKHGYDKRDCKESHLAYAFADSNPDMHPFYHLSRLATRTLGSGHRGHNFSLRRLAWRRRLWL